MSRFEGKSVIVTGSSNGIGRSTALQFAKEGAQVTITGRNVQKLEEVKQEILKLGRTLNDVNVVVGDICDTSCQVELLESTLKKFGKLDILVNNAGASFTDREGKFGIQGSMEAFDENIKLNLRSVVELIQKCRPHLIATKGEIVNVSTIAALQQPFVFYTYYGAAKAGLDLITRALAIELIEHGVRVNSVSPGLITTGFLNAVGMDQASSEKAQNYYGSHRDCIPVGHPGSPEDVALLIAFLADRKSSGFILGQSIVIDGGTSLICGMASHDMNKVLG